MDEDYFKNLRTVGSTLDEGISNLQDAWKIPNLLLCKSNEEDQLTAKKLVDNLRNELRLLKETITENKADITNLRDTHTQFLEESTKAIKSLKEEVDEIKVLFLENGYVEDPAEPDLSVLTNQLESLSFNGNVSHQLARDASNSVTTQDNDSPMCENAPIIYDSPMTTREPSQLDTPSSNTTFGSMAKRSLTDERPLGPMYSPYYYKTMKK